MEYYIDLSTWISSVVSLFGGVYDAVMDLPVLRFFLVVLIFLVAVSLLAWLVRRGSRQKL